MSDKLTGHNKQESQNGVSTVELLLAFALAIGIIIGTTMVVQSNESLTFDSLTNSEALLKAQALLEDARAQSRQNYSSVVTTVPVADSMYTKQVQVDQKSVTQCGKDVASTVSWTGSNNRSLSVQAKTHVTDFTTALALTHCATTVPIGGWNPPYTFASSNFNPGKPTGLDVFNGIVYMSGDKPPYFYVADTNTATLGQSSGLFVSFANGFSAGAQLNDVKVARLSNGRTYAFVVRHTTTNQFQVIDVTDIYNPVEVVKRSLAGVSSGGSFPQGWRLYYYAGRVYLVTRETTGPELHVFDVSNPGAFPGSIVELGGRELNETVEALVVANQGTQLYAYMATDSASRELDVWNVTNSLAMSRVTAAVQDLSGGQDGASVFALNGLVYFGRESSGGSEYYIFDAHNPTAGLPILQQKDLGTSLIGMAIVGQFAFLSTAKANAEMQVWSADPTKPITQINTTTFIFPNLIYNGIVYEQPYVYVASQGNDALRLLYSP